MGPPTTAGGGHQLRRFQVCEPTQSVTGSQSTSACKIALMEGLEFTQGLSDQDGNQIVPSWIGLTPDFPNEIRPVGVLKARGDMAELTIAECDWPEGQLYVCSLAGMHQSLDKMAASLAKG